ncbi:MAG: GNAT family N-acetyltransferase [Aestuariivirgaceae bacterium]
MLLLARHRIETDRLALRHPEDTDAERIAELANHIEIAQNLATMPHPYGVNDANEFIAKVATAKQGATFVVVCKGDDDVIGMAGYGPVEAGDHIDFGYWLGRDYWGKGYASEAAQAVLTHAFCIGRVDEIDTDCRIDNPGSRRILDKLGFQSSGPRERYSLGANETVPTEGVRLSCDDWLATKAVSA